jgi:hypothetical protein
VPFAHQVMDNKVRACLEYALDWPRRDGTPGFWLEQGALNHGVPLMPRLISRPVITTATHGVVFRPSLTQFSFFFGWIVMAPFVRAAASRAACAQFFLGA